MSVRNYSIAILLLISALGCSRSKTGSTPDETLRNLVQAVNDRDSNTFLANLSTSIRQRNEKHDLLRWTFDTTRGTTFSYALIKSDTDGTVANVSFWLQSTGRMTIPRTRVDAQLYKENDSWKFGVVNAVGGKHR